ncbi:uncharacterized protein EV420DRAFT_1768027 [Desarmillaria tabescens]|uniref:Uncharacterized protein n=1 Tax=Armillaria tabescens TaxID=1929756 RepID=A0AA39JM36_ARMTA|nr:uncharacterized protein EV420DRAFT_1768027 [Desarmillaria tabescens]KAK0445281.1 hypothetical protein EV420DRAFT_1768027 [Desarmillaria tabescens]
MTAQTNASIPISLTDSDIAYLTNCSDASLNSTILLSLLLGIYTGIIAVTMWNITISKSQHIGQAMVVVIIILYIMTIIGFGMTWSLLSSEFISYGENMWTRYLKDVTNNILGTIGVGVTGIIGGILADSIMIWRCWMIWGKHWLVIVLPSLCLICGVVFKTITMHLLFISNTWPSYFYLMLYASFTLATTLWCTALIVYRILSVGQTNNGIRGALGIYRHIIEVLVESSTLYSICLILYVANFACNTWGEDYVEVITLIARGIAPTLLIGRVAAGHARPDDSWEGSIMSSLHFGQGQSQTSIQEDSIISINLDSDLEAQAEQVDEPEDAQRGSQRVNSDDTEAQLEKIEII